MNRLSVRSVIVLPALLLLLAPFGVRLASGAASGRKAASAFELRIVDQHTGQGLARVRVTTDNGLACYTRSDGSVAWTEPSLMGRDVHFAIHRPGHTREATVRVTHGGHVDLAVR